MSWLLGNVELIGAGIIAGLLFLVKIFAGKAKREGKRADQAEARVEYVEEVQKLDEKTKAKFASRRAKVLDEIDVVPEHMREPD